MPQMSDRWIPPQNTDAEMSVLGCLLLDQEKLPTVLEVLKPEDFYREEHKEIYLAILGLFEKSAPIDILTVEEQLRSRGSLSRTGGMSYLGELAAGVISSENAKHYAGIVAQKALLRKLIRECSKIVEESYAAGEDAEAIIEAAEMAIFGIMEDRNQAGVVHVRQVIGEIYDKLPKQLIHGNPTGDSVVYENGEIVGLKGYEIYNISHVRLFDLIWCAGEINAQPIESYLSMFKGILKGYDSMNPLTAAEKQAIYYVLCTAAMNVVANWDDEFDVAKRNLRALVFLAENNAMFANLS